MSEPRGLLYGGGKMSAQHEDDDSHFALTEADYADDDDTPSADPNIQLKYEAALGEFVVEFNRLDDTVGKVLSYALAEIDRGHLSKQYLAAPFSQRVDLLDLLGGSDVLKLKAAPIARLKEISATRNILVHAHFDQNPFDGSYTLVQKGRESHLKAEAIRRLSKQVSDVTHKLGYHEAVWAFRDTGIGDESAS